MKYSEFKASLSGDNSILPQGLSPELMVLAYSKTGHWEKAHNIAQNLPEPNGAWLHAYLHREEGDLSNASYWYHRANRPIPSTSISEEWEQITLHFCQ